jgi:membrane protein implicated in regulation of membrane protease activity
MNRALLIVGIPAVVTSFCWLAFGWGWRVAMGVTASEIVAITAVVIYASRRQNQRESQQQSNR